MGVLDKIKNALFEVEYVEVEEPPKKEKKAKVKEPKENKPIAKKIVLPGKKEDKVEEIEEEELLDEDFEIRPKDETVVKESFKLMDDDDFKVDDTDDYPIVDEPEIIEEEPKVEEPVYHEEYQEPKVESKPVYQQEKAYQQEKVYPEKESKLYGMDNSYSVQAHQYGTYERYEERSYFKPSPIISPIYGILDKNYKKEDVKEKQEVKLSSYTRGKVSVDDIRDKAYGKHEEIEEDTKFETDDDEEKLMVDLSDKAKPEVKEITVGDALEYFQDLGLEYNVDYVDASVEKPSKEEKVEKEEVIVEQPEEPQEIEKKVEEVKEEAVEEPTSDEDNLFDLIDSMYKENN